MFHAATRAATHAATRAAILAVLLACPPPAGGFLAHAAAPQATFDLTTLPAASGKVAQYSLTPVGDVDGLILADGTEVHFPPRLGTLLAEAVKPGDDVTIHGLRARAVPMMQAVAITNDATGRTVTDDGEPPGGSAPVAPRGDRQAMAAQGQVRLQLHGPRGDLNGVLLTDGTIVRLPPPEAQRLADLLRPGMTLAAQGRGVSGPFGCVLEATRLGADPANMTALPPALPPPPAPR